MWTVSEHVGCVVRPNKSVLLDAGAQNVPSAGIAAAASAHGELVLFRIMRATFLTHTVPGIVTTLQGETTKLRVLSVM